MLTDRMIENAHKVAYLVQQYPEGTLDDILAKIGMPAINVNSSLWAAEELGFIAKPTNDGKMEFLKEPEEWVFGSEVDELKAMIVFGLYTINNRDQDLDEEFFTGWTQGHAPHNIFVAVKQLLNQRVIATYELTDPQDLESTYTFYTLFENLEQMLGRKQFKVEPTGAEKPKKTPGRSKAHDEARKRGDKARDEENNPDK